MAKRPRKRDLGTPVPAAPLRPSLWILLGLVALVLLAYQPAWQGEPVWDDTQHMTEAALGSPSGLLRIWTELGVTQQYYPLTHSAFWIQHALWGSAPLGHHLVNITLHAVSAFLVIGILGRLGVPGAWFAGLLFAVHPVQVESVAWISELKNVLSGVLYLLAARAYLEYDAGRTPAAYRKALTLFVLSLLAKTVTATLPAALLVVFWWKRGRIDGRRDVQPLVPFFAIGLASGLFTAWVERTVIGAHGTDYSLTLIERCLVASRALWFYLSTLAWPTQLTFIYPRWDISQSAPLQYGYLAAALALVTAAWWWRSRTRAPLAALLMFGGTLLPALGFVNVYPFRFSYVADHFQYLATIPIFALVAGAFATATATRGRAPRIAAAALLLAPLGAMTWQQAGHYASAETLYRATLVRNPEAWIAHSNLGELLLNRRPAEAVEHIEAALRLAPDLAEARNNLGSAYHLSGQLEAALDAYTASTEAAPTVATGHNNRCAVLWQLERFEDAVEACAEALRLDPAHAEAHLNMGIALLQLDRLELAIEHLGHAAELRPAFADSFYYLGIAQYRDGRVEAAVDSFTRAIEAQPDFGQAYNHRGVALRAADRPEEAAASFAGAVRVQPGNSEAAFNLANTLVSLGRIAEAIPYYETTIAAAPMNPVAHFNLGAAFESLGRITEAVSSYREALRLQPDFAQARDALARLGRTGGR